MSVASSFPCIKIPTSSSAPSCSYSSSSSFSSTSSSSSSCFRFSCSRVCIKTAIRSSQTEGPIRRPVAPSLREPSPPPSPLKPTPPSQPPSTSSSVPPPKPASVAGVVSVEDKNVITLEFQRQKAKELQDYFKQKKLEEANQGPFFGFIGKNEIANGRWAMFGFAVGMLTEYATGSDFVDQVGQGTYSNVYKARDRDTGKIVALKKVRFDTSEPESVKFMAREIMILQKLDHPNIVKLEGLATSRMQYSLYLVFEFMQSDLARIISRPEGLTEPQVKCYMYQLLSGLQHCHDRGILHRDIKGSNLLIDKNGMLKIADFGLANNYTYKHPLTNRVVTLWYRAPELLLGATNYGVGIDLWSAGCLLAEMFLGRPIMPGRTEVEQLHSIFKLCGTPSEDYWKKLKLPTTFRPSKSYKPCFQEVFMDLPASSLGLLSILLALDPLYRGNAFSALQNKFFFTSPLACDLSDLPVVYNEDDELDQANELRNNSKMKRRSRTHRERGRKYSSVDKHGDSVTSKEELQKTAEPRTQSEEPGSTTSSTSSSVNLTGQKESPFFSLSPIRPSDQKMSERNQGYPNASMNNKNLPPLPKSKARITIYNKENNIYKANHVHRSASSKEFRNAAKMEHLALYAVEN